MTVEAETNEEIRVLRARISTLEAENTSLRDDIGELEREMEYISQFGGKSTKTYKTKAER